MTLNTTKALCIAWVCWGPRHYLQFYHKHLKFLVDLDTEFHDLQNVWLVNVMFYRSNSNVWLVNVMFYRSNSFFFGMCDVFRYDIVFVCNNSFSLLCISKILYLNIKLASLAAEHKCLDLNLEIWDLSLILTKMVVSFPEDSRLSIACIN